MNRRLVAVLLTAAVAAASCSNDNSGAANSAAPDTTLGATTSTATLAKATFTVQPGTEQVAVFGATPGEELSVKLDGAPPAVTAKMELASYDVAAARKLMAEAGYPNGFSVTLDCSNDRYNND